MHHYERIVLCKDINLQRGRIWASSLASCCSRSREERSPWMIFIQVARGRRGWCVLLSGGGTKMTWLASAFSSILARYPPLVSAIFHVKFARMLLLFCYIWIDMCDLYLSCMYFLYVCTKNQIFHAQSVVISCGRKQTCGCVGSGRRGVVRLYKAKWLCHCRRFPRSAQVDSRVPWLPKDFRQVRSILLPVIATAGEKRTSDWIVSRAVGSDAEVASGV